MTDTQIIDVSNSLIITYIDGDQTKKYTIKYINPDATNAQLLTWSKMFFNTFSAATYVWTQRVVQGTLVNLEV